MASRTDRNSSVSSDAVDPQVPASDPISPVIDTQEENTVTQIIPSTLNTSAIGSQFVPSPRRQTELTAADVLALSLGETQVSVLGDVVQNEAGEWHMPFYNRETRLLEGPQVVFTTNRKRYEKQFWTNFNATFLDDSHRINMRSLGRAIAVVNGYHAFFAGEDIIAQFPKLQGASAVVAFVSKTDNKVIRFVRFEGLKAQTYRIEYDFNRDILGNVFITNRYLKQHELRARLEQDADGFNEWATTNGLNPINKETLRDKFELAAYMAMGFRVIIPVWRDRIETVDPETGVLGNRIETNADMIARLTTDGIRGQAKLNIMTDAFQRETAQIAGLRRDAFVDGTALLPSEEDAE